MITNTLQDPDAIKSNNEVAKAALKRRLETHQSPGPGDYNPQKNLPLGQSHSPHNLTLDTLAELKKGKDRNLLSKLGLNENLVGKKGMAFNSAAPRFQSETSRNNHNRSRTINGEEI